jgi:hypothetical protein
VREQNVPAVVVKEKRAGAGRSSGATGRAEDVEVDPDRPR